MGRTHETSSKKDIAKKKREKRKEKAERRELRQSNTAKGKGLEEMLAYVDENGNLSATPPDPRRKKEVKAEDISLEASGNNTKEDTSLKTGVVTFFDTTKGFGFIKDADSPNSYFVHTNDLSEPIKERDKVTFEIAKGQKGMKAIMVKKQR
ncbi:MAG TPA: cold shock domain-containing protein [Chitinophagaceae bacterium]|nr:cold shock domain-containing protein [Chitinophagaceae bacterium]